LITNVTTTNQEENDFKWRKKSVEEIVIYPNPTAQNVNNAFSGFDENESIHLRIFSIDGKVVYDHSTSVGAFNQAIDLRNFEKGVYLLEYEYGETVEREKVVVQ